MKKLYYSYIGNNLLHFEYYIDNKKQHIIATFYAKSIDEAIDKCLKINNLNDYEVSIYYADRKPQVNLRLDYIFTSKGYLVELFVNNQCVRTPFYKFRMESLNRVVRCYREIFGLKGKHIELCNF